MALSRGGIRTIDYPLKIAEFRREAASIVNQAGSK